MRLTSVCAMRAPVSDFLRANDGRVKREGICSRESTALTAPEHHLRKAPKQYQRSSKSCKLVPAQHTRALPAQHTKNNISATPQQNNQHQRSTRAHKQRHFNTRAPPVRLVRDYILATATPA